MASTPQHAAGFVGHTERPSMSQTLKGFDNTAQGRVSAPWERGSPKSANPERVSQGVPLVSQSLTQIYLHITFSTKGRLPLLVDTDLRAQTHAYLAGICKNLESTSLIVGGVSDHVHILCRLSKNIAVAALVRELKRDSKWIKTKRPDLVGFHWQAGYGAFSISPSHVGTLKQYIASQEEHHRIVTFQDEFRRLCQKYGVEIDKRYAWD
jgi:putative transposase